MGFFSKLKDNFTQGGVKVSLQAPASVSMQDAALPVAVAVTATDSPQTVNKVTVEIIAETMSQSFNTQSTSATTSTPTRKTVARAENVQPIALAPGETKTVNLSIVMNVGAQAAEQLPEGSGAAQIAGAMQKLQSFAQAMNQDNYKYFVTAVADVEGVAFDPSDRQPIQILKPGEFGGAMRFGG